MACVRRRSVCDILSSRTVSEGIRVFDSGFNSMRRRQLSVFSLVAALFLSAWAQGFAASLCPQLRHGYACCRARAAAHSRERDETAGRASHEMSSGRRTTRGAESSRGAKILDAVEGADGEVTEACDHCAGQSSEQSL